MDTSRDLPMSDENIQMLIRVIEKECAIRAQNNLREMDIFDLESHVSATIPDYMRYPIMNTIIDMAEDARRRCRRLSELTEQITFARKRISTPTDNGAE
jgi:hypothetical protein